MRWVVTSERIVEAADRKKEMERKRAIDVTEAEKELRKAETLVLEAKRKLTGSQRGADLE